MSTSAVFRTCQIPCRSGLPSFVRGGAYACPCARLSVTESTATASNAPAVMPSSEPACPLLMERTSTRRSGRLLLPPGIVGGAVGGNASKQRSSVRQRHLVSAGNPSAVLRQIGGNGDLGSWRHRALGPSAPEQRVWRAELE